MTARNCWPFPPCTWTPRSCTRAGPTRSATPSSSGPDPYFDDLFCTAAERAYVSCERVVPTTGLTADAPVQTLRIQRWMVTGVVEAPNGAHFTSCEPDYARDEDFQRGYVRAAAGHDPESWRAFSDRFLGSDEAGYQAAVADWRESAAGTR